MSQGSLERILLLWLGILLCSAMVQSQESPQAPVTGSQDQSPSGNSVAAEKSPSILLTATAIALIEPVEHNVLHRPIELADEYVHWVERSYAYGSTQMQTRAVHLGVEFVNPRNTPVYAAKSGVVIFAGDDSMTLLGPQLDYYGRVVVLAHQIYSLVGRQVFTLYGHLEDISVEMGQSVEDLDQIGRIGSSGVAIGPHLHFEVRVDDPFDYRMTRNPELWMQHYVDRGMIIGRIRDHAGQPVYGKRVSVRSDSTRREVFSYGSDIVNPDQVWDEDFSVGDLPAGTFEVIVLDDSGVVAFVDTITVEAYRTTFVEIILADF